MHHAESQTHWIKLQSPNKDAISLEREYRGVGIGKMLAELHSENSYMYKHMGMYSFDVYTNYHTHSIQPTMHGV